MKHVTFKKLFTALICAAVAVTCCVPVQAAAKSYKLSLQGLYTDSGAVKGTATKGTVVKVTLEGVQYQAKTRRGGGFTVKIPRQKAGTKAQVNLYKGKQRVKSKTLKVYPAQVVYQDGFSYHRITSAVKKRVQGKSYKKNKHINLDQLRYVRVKHYDFDGNVKAGELIVNRKIARDIVEIFYELYQNEYPLEEVSLIDKYDADDGRSMKANNTSAFNYRKIAGTKTLSRHAYGMAIDINPRINPYVVGNFIDPKNGSVYAQRDVKKCRGAYKKWMIHKNDFIYRLFIEHGFEWGGDWKRIKDYQHFEKN